MDGINIPIGFPRRFTQPIEAVEDGGVAPDGSRWRRGHGIAPPPRRRRREVIVSSVLLRIADNNNLFNNFTQLLDMLASAENCENPLLWRYEVTGRNNETFVFTLDQSVDNRQWMLELGHAENG